MAVDVLTDFFLQTFFKVCGFLRRYEFRYEMEQVDFTVWPENHLGQRKSIACSVNESRISNTCLTHSKFYLIYIRPLYSETESYWQC